MVHFLLRIGAPLMKHVKNALSIIILLAVCLFSTALHVHASSTDKPIVVTTTTVLESIVKDLAGDKVSVVVIASPAICPAHYDVRPSDVEAFRIADLILAHGIEPWVEDLKKASGSEAPIVYIKGPWNMPDTLKQRYSEVANAIEEHLGISVSDKLSKSLSEIDEVKQRLQGYAEEHGFKNTPVVSMMWQKGFISFLGFKVVATYRSPEMVSAKEYSEIIENATKYGAVLVIDNLQSGVELGEKIASEVGAVEVALTNFPGTAPGLNNVTEVMKYNARLLAEALVEATVMKEKTMLERQIGFWRTTTYTLAVLAIALGLALLYIVWRRR